MLLFNVNGQTLKRTDHFNPATDSVEYLKAKFTFGDSAWSGKTKTALFRLGNDSYKSVLGTDGTCKVPSEVLVGGDNRLARIHGEIIYVSLIGEYGIVRITTNEIAIKLNRSGYGDAETPADPTESEYQQMTAVAADAVAEAENARIECENARADLVGVKNIFANAIKGNLSGPIVFADDVSPVEHNPVVWVHGKNLLPDTVDDLANWNLVDGTVNNYVFPLTKLKDNTKYTISATVLDNSFGYFYIEKSANGFVTNSDIHLHFPNSSALPYTFEKEKGYEYRLFWYDDAHAFAEFASNIQLEEGETATTYEPWIETTTVTVRRCGKSVFSKASQVVSGVSKPWTSLLVCAVKVPVGNYVASCNFKQQGQDISRVAISVRDYDDYTVAFGDDSDTEKSGYLEKSFTVPSGSKGFQIFLYSNQPNEALTTECLFENIQVELGQKATLYEPYNGEEYIPASDGTVSGITSLSSNMTILTDTEGMIVECEYNRDTNKVIEKLTNAIIALGGTV